MDSRFVSNESKTLFFEAIQKDALSDPMAQTTPEQEEQIRAGIDESYELEIQRLRHNIDVYRERWHEARKHLRAANKGAERNARALELSATRYWELVHSDRRWKERDENEHKTIVWNWLLLSDEDLRLKCGELSSQDIRNIRAVLRAMLGSSLTPRHNL